MSFIKTAIEGLVIFEPNVFGDNRGYLFESYNKKLFAENGIDCDFVQDNQSYSKYGTIRGLHFQKGEYAQAKLVRVIKGNILDVCVDLRPNSPTFGRHVTIEISGEDNKEVFIPRGCAHGFSVLSEEALFTYKCDNFYNPSQEGSVIYNDEILGINWQIPEDKILLSEKDRKGPSFEEYKENPCF